MLQQILDSLRLFGPETALALTFCVAILSSVVLKKESPATPLIVLAGLIIAGMLVIQEASAGSHSIFSGMISVDPFSVYFKLLILGVSLLIVVFSMQSVELRSGARRLGEYYSLLVAMTLGMTLMAGASNLLMMYLSLELTSISSYILAGFTKEAEDSSEASLKYVLYGAVSSGLMLYGISLIYGLTGTVNIQEVNHALAGAEANSVALVIAGMLVIVGFGYKISAVPFHFWTPDVYEGAPVTITAFLSVASKAAGFAMMIRFFRIVFVDPAVGNLGAGFWGVYQSFQWNQVLAIISVLTMTLGNLIAVWQDNLKRLLAYSSIAQAGYMLLGVVVLSNSGIAAVLIYFAVYLFMNLGAFYVVMLVANETGSEHIDSYRGLGYRSPLIGVALAIFLLSLTGIPPTAGFIGKLYIFAALINGKWFWLAVIGVLNSVVSLYYYIRVIRNMFLRQPDGPVEPLRIRPAQVVVLLVLLVPTILLGLYFTPLVEFAQASVAMFGVH